jgi:hypothetical protein
MSDKKYDNKMIDFSTLPEIKLYELLEKYRHIPVKSRLDAMKKQYYLDAVRNELKKKK